MRVYTFYVYMRARGGRKKGRGDFHPLDGTWEEAAARAIGEIYNLLRKPEVYRGCV